MKYTVFVDGQEGTTGLRLHRFLSKLPHIELITIDSDHRKDRETRKTYLNEADIAILCLPDDASREAISMVYNPNTRIVDASTAFRTTDDWTYGLPELCAEQRDRIRKSKRVAVPGCHATGFILAVQPLVAEGIVPREHPTSCYAITGYSGGGKRLIAEYENHPSEKLLAPRPYSLGLKHKHLPEMQRYSGLLQTPLFTPIVGPYYQGDAVSIPLFTSMLRQRTSARQIHECLSSYYEGERFIRVAPFDSSAELNNGFFDVTGCNETNQLELFVFGNEEHVVVIARFDNLGKGAARAAVQNLNLMLGVDEGMGIV